MEHIKELRQALESLLEELSRQESEAGHPDPGAEHVPPDGQENSVLRELSAYLAETKDDIGQVLSSHPAATAGAAFLLGVAVGRLSR